VDGVVAEHAMDHRPPVPPPHRYQTTRNGWTEVMLFVKELRRGEETAEEYQVVKTWKTRQDKTTVADSTGEFVSSVSPLFHICRQAAYRWLERWMDAHLLQSRRPNRTPSSVCRDPFLPLMTTDRGAKGLLHSQTTTNPPRYR
jgi:hypothetical protein